MARKRQFKRRERRQRSSKTLRRAGLGVAIALPVLYFAFTKVFFDPFESSQPAFEALVPRDVDVFVRRERLDTDFTAFPVPVLFERLARTRQWRELSQSSLYQALAWPPKLEALAEELERSLAEAPIDPLADVVGREVALVGRLGVQGAGEPQYALMARISGRTKLALELLDFDAVLERALPGATRSSVSDPDVPGLRYDRLEVPGQGSFFYARENDVLVVGQHEALLRDVLRTVRGGPETSLGLSRFYDEHLPPSSASPEDHFSAEFLLDIRQLLAQTDGDPAAAVPEEPGEDALATTFARLLDVRLLGEVVGRLSVADGISLTAHGELSDAGVPSPRAGLLGATSFVVRERLSDIAGRLLPADTSALLTMNVELKPLLTTIVESLNSDVQTLLNDTIKGLARYSPTWKVDNLPGLISYLGRTLEDEVTVALRPLDHDVPAGAQPLPLIAVILRVKDLNLWNGLDDAVVRGHKQLGLDPQAMYQQDEGVGTRKWLGLAGLPMDEIAYIVLDRTTAIIATDDDFLREIVAIYTNSRSSLMTKADVRGMVESFGEARGNIAVWGSAEALRTILDPWADWLAEDDTRVDYVPVRIRLRKELLASRFSSWQGKEEAMPPEVSAELDAELDRQISVLEQERLQQQVPERAAAFREKLAWLALLDNFAVSLRLVEHEADLNLRATTALGRRLP